MKPRYVLGLDGGGSKTECALCSLQTDKRYVVRGDGSNHEGVGYERAGQVVHELFNEVLREAGIQTGDIVGACFAMAGMDVEPDRGNITERIVEPLGLSCPLYVCNDAFAGFRAGSPHGVGICVSLGAGVTFCGRNAQNDTLQFEYPAPAGIDLRIINALLAEYHGVGPACGFTEGYLKMLGLKSLEEYFWSRYAAKRDFGRRIDPARQREARRAVFEPAMHDDPETCRMLGRYADELAEILIGMARRLKFEHKIFDFVMSGSLLIKGRHPALNGTLVQRIKEKFPGAEPVLVDGLPVDGAIRIAKELAGVKTK